MRIKIYGGPLTISYNMAKFLKRKNMDVTLYIDKTPLDESYRPGWEDEGFEDYSGSWIKEVNVSLRNCMKKEKKEKDFLNELRDADILHMYGESSIWANFTEVPYIYNSYGYDLDQMPFHMDSVKAQILSYMLKRSVSRAKYAIISPHQENVLKKLKLKPKITYVPYPIDSDKYKKHDTRLKDELMKKGDYDFIFFSPTRHEWSHSYTSNKGNDKVINAFARFIKDKKMKALLILIEKGDDLEKSKALIKSNGIEDYILWIGPQNKKSLIEYYSASHIVLDQFTLGGFGQVFLESMSCGIPTFIYLKGYDDLYSEQPPCVNVSTEHDIFEKLVDLTSSPKTLEEMGRKSRQWIMEYHDWRTSVERHKNLYEKIIK